MRVTVLHPLPKPITDLNRTTAKICLRHLNPDITGSSREPSYQIGNALQLRQQVFQIIVQAAGLQFRG
jgi:hypothetical protein